MELQQILEQLSATALSSILEEHGRSTAKWVSVTDGDDDEANKVEEQREQLYQLLTDQRSLHGVYRSLSEYERYVLLYFIYHVGQELLTHRQINNLGREMKLLSFRLGLTGLRRKGLIYTVRRQWGEEAYFLPLEIETKFYYMLHRDGVFSKVLSDKPGMNDRQAIKEEQGHPVPALVRDLFVVLDVFRHEEGGRLSLTRKRAIHKRVVRQMEEQLCGNGLDLQAYSRSFIPGDVYSPYLTLLLDFLTRERVLIWRAETVELNESHVVKWLKYGRQYIREAFLTYWQQTLIPNHKWTERYVKDLFLLRQTDVWYGWLEMVEMWEDQYTLPSVRDVLDSVKAVLSPLVELGFIQLGTSETGERMWRWIKWHESVDPPWIQPNFEIICSGLVSLTKVWEYTKLCTIRQWDAMLQLRLSEKRANAYIESGADVSTWLSILEQEGATSLPTSWKDRLEQWQRGKKRVSLHEVVLLKCHEPELVRALETWLHQEQIPFQMIQADSFVLPLEVKEQVLLLFQQRDIYIQEPDKWRSAEEPEVPVSFFKTHDKRSRFKIESTFPEYAETIPEWGRIPEAWKKQFSAYHQRTVRDIVQYAAEHRLVLRIEDQRGRLVNVTPYDCYPRDGIWYMQDHRERSMALHEIKRIQVVLLDHGET